MEHGLFALLLEAMALRRADARQEFIDAEGLGDVIVSAAIERFDLGGFLFPAERIMIGRFAPLSLIRSRRRSGWRAKSRSISLGHGTQISHPRQRQSFWRRLRTSPARTSSMPKP